ncbi:MAG TPA: Fe-S cluster assembly protein SufD [Steroidobacteraceae bacterium]|nr:Fe-S cluster assembly protein SufD [Steroidobacteraceae bacterium]
MSALPSLQESSLMVSLRAAFAALPKPAAAQLHAWEQFNQIGLPGLRDEQWKYTQLHRLYSQSFALKTRTPVITADSSISISEVPSGITHTGHAFEALVYALSEKKILIAIPDDAVIKDPVVIDFNSTSTESSINATRILIKAGKNSSVTIIERYRGTNESAHLNIGVTDIFLGENAQINHCRLQNENTNDSHVAIINVNVEKNACYINHHFNLGGSVARADINVKLEGAEAYAELNGLQFAAGNQVHDTHSRVEHCVPRANSSETYHGIADERGQVVFNGKVLVHKHAIGTDAQQSSRNLLLSPRAEIDTKPELEIYADDVKCSHGATIGQLDNTALFYLRSRGIGEQAARALLTLAFADAVINKLPLAALREELTQQVHSRFGNKVEHAS